MSCYLFETTRSLEKRRLSLLKLAFFVVFLLIRRRFLVGDDVVCGNNVSYLPLWFYPSKYGGRFHDDLKTVSMMLDTHHLFHFFCSSESFILFCK